ncbi:MAG: putative toxin-antitoxin system toxin component, PIN family [Planctomycetaceae bacterium]
MKVVVDTMMWVSFATFPRGFRGRLIKAALERRVRFFVSRYQLDEFVNTLLEHFELTRRFANNSRKTVEILAKTVALPSRIPRYVERDPKDDAIVQTALSARADYLEPVQEQLRVLTAVISRGIVFSFVFLRAPALPSVRQLVFEILHHR